MFWKFLYTSLLYSKGHKLPHETHDNLSNLFIKISDLIFLEHVFRIQTIRLVCYKTRSRAFDDTVSLLLGIERYAPPDDYKCYHRSLLLSRPVLVNTKEHWIDSMLMIYYHGNSRKHNHTISTRPNDPIFYDRGFSTSVGFSVS